VVSKTSYSSTQLCSSLLLLRIAVKEIFGHSGGCVSRAWIIPVVLQNTPYEPLFGLPTRSSLSSTLHLPFFPASAALLVVRLPVAGATEGAASGSVVGGSARGVLLRLAAGFALLLGTSG